MMMNMREFKLMRRKRHTIVHVASIRRLASAYPIGFCSFEHVKQKMLFL